MTYTVSRDIEETKEAQQAIVESAKIQIRLLDAGNENISIEFSRVQGSVMIFYDEFNLIKKEFGHFNNVAV